MKNWKKSPSIKKDWGNHPSHHIWTASIAANSVAYSFSYEADWSKLPAAMSFSTTSVAFLQRSDILHALMYTCMCTSHFNFLQKKEISCYCHFCVEVRLEGERERERLRGCWGQKTIPIKERLQLLPVHSAAWLYNICRQRLMIKHQVLKINLSLFISSYTSFTSKAEGRRRPEEKGGGGRRWNCSLIARKRWEWESWLLFTSTFDDVIWNKSFPLPPGMDSRFWDKSSSCTHKHAHTNMHTLL